MSGNIFSSVFEIGVGGGVVVVAVAIGATGALSGFWQISMNIELTGSAPTPPKLSRISSTFKE